MTAAAYHLTIDQGSDFAVQLAVKENDVVKDLTSWNARAQLRSKKSDATLVATFTCTVIDAAGGLIKMEMSNSISTTISAGIYYYDLELYTPSDVNVTRLLEGQVTITQEVTR